jgi:KaiC/GvpD/RAD55 family RecA-like ATPase
MERIILDEISMQGVIPTGIPSLDPLLFGGLPPGSFVLLIGESGAGCEEFAYTSITNLSHLKTRSDPKLTTGITLPQRILYITITRRKEDIIQDISRGFARDMRAELQKVHFTDLSDIYFNKSLVPIHWYSKNNDATEQTETKNQVSDNILTALSNRLDQTPHQSLIVLNTLTELATQFPAKTTWPEFTAYLRGLQRALKMWGSCMYLILTHGILNSWQECELGDISDAVIHFQWEVTPTAKRQRVLFIDKFRGVLPQLEEKELMKFTVKITPSHGFEVSNIRAII